MKFRRNFLDFQHAADEVLTGLRTVEWWLASVFKVSKASRGDPGKGAPASVLGEAGVFLTGDNEYFLGLFDGRLWPEWQAALDVILVEECNMFGVEVEWVEFKSSEPSCLCPLFSACSLLLTTFKLHSHSVKNMASEVWPKLWACPHSFSKMATPLKAVWVSALVFSVPASRDETAEEAAGVEDEGAELLRLLEADSAWDDPLLTVMKLLPLVLGVVNCLSEGLWTPSGASWK